MIDYIDSAQKAQRNYDLSKSIPEEDLHKLIYAAANSPSKQNETHYRLEVFTDQTVIRNIYNHTKKFLLKLDDSTFGETKGDYWQDDSYSVTNPQILANALFVYIDDQGEAVGGTHKAGQVSVDGKARMLYDEQKNLSIGISVGELILSASIMGYKTGICSAMDSKPIMKLLGVDKRVKLLVGVGFANESIDRRVHPEVHNKHLPKEFHTGLPEERWIFPTFAKEINVSLNGIDYKL